jgi:hypothetical protein
MTENVLQLWPQLLGMITGSAVLILFALVLALPHRPKILPGSSGHRDIEDQGEHEEIRGDGYIDSFSGEIEEAGGSIPPVVLVAIPGVLIWWLLYLILFWKA